MPLNTKTNVSLHAPRELIPITKLARNAQLVAKFALTKITATNALKTSL
jgi:hypothetical protein